jgi:ubiquitin carboxyl-terminal hydrolase 25/28
LGIDATASDALVIFAYKKQLETDPSRFAWYLSYLNQISRVRQSDEIELEIVLQQSEGRFTLEQVDEAYRYFGFTMPDADDEHIIGTYKSRLSDAPRQDSEMREQLRIIGEHRQSARIKDIAKGSK